MLPRVADVGQGARFALGLHGLLREHITPEQAERAFRARLEGRDATFLALARDAIYAKPSSPYRQLLEAAGCELGDLERMVQRGGLEDTLRELFSAGVYLTTPESKGRVPVRRGSTSFTVDPAALRDPRSTADMVRESSGSRGERSSVPFSFGALRDQAEELGFDNTLRGLDTGEYAVWAVPGYSALSQLIRCAMLGTPAQRWFSMVDPVRAGLHPRYVWSERVLRATGLLAGVAFPRPEVVPISDPGPIVAWLESALRAGRQPRLRAYVSPVVRVCEAAFQAGVDLRGAAFIVGGEPMTAPRRAAIERTGATVMIHFGATEGGNLARSCLQPVAPDDLHVSLHRHAVIQPGGAAPPDLPPTALMVTSLSERARLVLLNVSLGDQAELDERPCGCPLWSAGLRVHIHTIRSFEKLTAGGMTFQVADVVRALEQVLPSRFGGGPTDYQIQDFEGHVRLAVHPLIGSVDLASVRAAFLDAMGSGRGVERVMGHVWSDAGLPEVVRESPRSTSGGKINLVHFERARVGGRASEPVGASLAE